MSNALRHAIRNTLLFSGSALLLNACALQSQPPELQAQDVPAQWSVAPQADVATWPDSDWWNTFADPELSGLIDTIRAQNLDLANNRRNLESAQITLREAGFDLLPTGSITLGTGASYSESRVDGVTSTGSPNTPVELGARVSQDGLQARQGAIEGHGVGRVDRHRDHAGELAEGVGAGVLGVANVQRQQREDERAPGDEPVGR